MKNWLGVILVSGLLLAGLRHFPVVATLLVTTLLCASCTRQLATPAANWAYAYPVVCYLLSQQFRAYSFFDIGDGPAYFAVVDYLLPRLQRTGLDGLANLLTAAGPKYLNLGFLPTAFLPVFFFDNPDSVTYQLAQACLHVALVSLLLCLTTRWNVIAQTYRTPVFLFMLVSPGYLALVAYPTRHHILSFGIFLLFISFEACLEKRTIGRLFSLAAAFVILFFCKAGLLPLTLLYGLFRLYQPNQLLRNLIVISLVVSAIFLIFPYLSGLYDPRYATETIGVFRGAWLGPLLPVYKYVMAIVSPFPYYKYGLMVNTIAYGGNWLLLGLFVPAGIVGLWLFCRLLLNPRILWAHDADTKRLFAYGGIMSLSILGGSTGFLMYILVYMPFFAPLFIIDKGRVPLAVVLLAVLLLHVVVMYVNHENPLNYL